MTVALNGAASSSSSGAYAPRCCGFLHVRVPRLGRLPVGDLDEDVAVIEHLVARAAKKAVLAPSLSRDHAFEQTPQLIPPTRFGPQFDDHFDGHIVPSGRPSALQSTNHMNPMP